MRPSTARCAVSPRSTAVSQGPQADTLDDLWYTTLMTYPGKPGVYPTHVRMWGIFPQTGVLASDFTGVERRRVMDAALTSVYNALFPFINSEIATTPAGRMSEAEKTQWAGRAINSLRRLRQDGAITFASAPPSRTRILASW